MSDSPEIIGVGVDLVKVSRIEQAALRSDHFAKRNFTDSELEYCSSRSEAYHHMAARFAAKEAVTKALRTTLRVQDVEVVHDMGGAPEIRLHGKTREEFPGVEFFLSLSHEDDFAIAYCIAVKTPTL